MPASLKIFKFCFGNWISCLFNCNNHIYILYIFFYSAVQIYEIHVSIIGLLVRATSNIKMRSQAKRQNGGWKSQKALRVSLPPSVRPNLGGRGRVISVRLFNRFGSWFGKAWTCYNSLSPYKKSFLTRKEHAIVDRFWMETYSRG